jgi:hypothetical protein
MVLREWADYVGEAVQENMHLEGGWGPARRVVVRWASTHQQMFYKAGDGGQFDLEQVSRTPAAIDLACLRHHVLEYTRYLADDMRKPEWTERERDLFEQAIALEWRYFFLWENQLVG